MANKSVSRVTKLVPTDYPPGQISRVHVELVADGLAADILLPVLVARGRKDGPVFGLTAAVHGNELNGIRVIHDLFENLDVDNLRGILVAVVCVNVPGLHANERQIHGQFDLNHLFPGSEGGDVAQVYAFRFLDRVVSKFQFLVDLHTASFGRVNSLYVRADLSHPVTRRMAFGQNPEIIVHNPPSDRTLRGAAMERGIAAITVEIGDPQQFQPRYVKSTRAGLRSILAEAGMLPKRPGPEGPTPILCEASQWIYSDRGGLLEVLPATRVRVRKGDPIARVRNAFGDLIREYFAPYDGVVIGKSINPVSPTGSRVLHLGREMYPDHPLWGGASREGPG
jgi:uncharacterized protein